MPENMCFTTSPGAMGPQMWTITTLGLAPNQQVCLVWGTHPGAQPFSPTCPGGTLLIRDPHNTIPPARADAIGVATFNVMVPRQAQGVTVRYQAIAPATCEISHTVEYLFQ